MLIKTAVCEDAIFCAVCERYHGLSVPCGIVAASENVLSSQGDSSESINKNDSNVTLSAKGVDNEE